MAVGVYMWVLTVKTLEKWVIMFQGRYKATLKEGILQVTVRELTSAARAVAAWSV